MGYLSRNQLEAMGFAALGANVMISDKAAIYGADQMRVGNNCRIDDFCVVSGKVEMGRNVHIAPFCLIAGGQPGIRFGDFAGMAYHAQVFAQSDDYSGRTMTNPTIPFEYKAETKMPVDLGRHTIIGAGAVIVPGVELGEGTSVGALSLILHSTEPWSIYVGNPGRRLKARDRGLLDHEAAYLASEEGQS